MSRFLTAVTTRDTLDPDQIRDAAAFLLDAEESPEAKAAFLKALAQRGERPEEIAGFVREFLLHAVIPPLDLRRLPGPMLDVVGTGGDKLNLFNVSTTAMFILAGGGVCVTKHGNRGITSKSGGADVLEALGVKIDLPPERTARGIETIGLGFFFAPRYHPAFAAVAPARQLLAAEKQRSMFNLLGPLLNPAQPAHQLIGVFDPSWTVTFGEILRQLGRQSAWIVHGRVSADQGMDELSTLGKNSVTQLRGGVLESFEVDAAALGFAAPRLSDLVGGDAGENAAILEGILDGSVNGPCRDIAVLNAAAGFHITGLAATLEDGVRLALDSLDRGAAHAKMRALRDWC
ncbi:MAG: anthranilate phosphoribosyltransferase [Verrucomicrobiales bacterium]|nr:anthranilate phosphoribosyltransferase [Verrucomicrobiales bacterium]